MQDLAHHILDIAENSVRAHASLVVIRLQERPSEDLLRLEIIDNGEGMSEEMRRQVLSPFTTSRTERRVGLGLALLAQAAREAGGDCRVESTPFHGTRIVADFRLSHIDLKPIGDLGETMLVLAVGHSDTDFALEIERGGGLRRFDTQEIRASLGDAPLCSPTGLRVLRGHLGEVLGTRPTHPYGLKESPNAC
ncbi:sensor histidine kinase [Candidatus Sumerlaeota bacterium]|nr:sensor histidine kinase [Candidatus Sumerlaeota bacterium]